jgi:putative mycofactocin binding protein MftB
MSTTFELDQAWALSPRVSIRPEPFGALLYNFGTRQLSFIKDRRLVAIVASLAEHTDVRHACFAHDVGEPELARFTAALARLAATRMIVPRTAGEIAS